MTLIFTSKVLRLAFAFDAPFDAVKLNIVENFSLICVKKCKGWTTMSSKFKVQSSKFMIQS